MASNAKCCLELVQRLVAQRIQNGGMDRLLSKVKITSAANGSLTAVMKVEKEHTNIGGTLHGAMTTYLVDALSTLTLVTCPEVKNVGVSLNINMVFIKGAPLGEELEIRSKADKTGGKLAFLSVDIVSKNSGELIAKGSHTKFTAISRVETDIPRS